MRLKQRDKRALMALAGAAVLVLGFEVFSGGNRQPPVVGVADSIPTAEKRLARVRRLAAGVPGREAVLKQVTAELAQREKGVIQAETAAQAQAQLWNIVRRAGRAQSPPLEFGSVELNQQTARLGDDYGEVRVSAPFTCRIEDLLNFLAALTQQPEALAITELRISATDPKQKTISVRLTVAGVVPRRLVPEKKGPF